MSGILVILLGWWKEAMQQRRKAIPQHVQDTFDQAGYLYLESSKVNAGFERLSILKDLTKSCFVTE
jgi:hypothetical protein